MKFQNFANLIEQGILFDSHCHLNEKSFDKDRDEVVERAKKAGLLAIIDMGVDIESSKKAVENARKYEIVYAAVGVEPENLVPGSDLFDEKAFGLDDNQFDLWLKEKEKDLEVLLDNPKVPMVGETGIDNYWIEKAKELSKKVKSKSLDRQVKLFRMHCRLSKKFNKPLSVHSRNAVLKCLEVLGVEGIEKGMCVFHSLTPDIGDSEKEFTKKVKRILNLGYFIGVNGIITFKNAETIRGAYKDVLGVEFGKINTQDLYENLFLLETDAPFLAPEPKRGERNEPAFLKYISL